MFSLLMAIIISSGVSIDCGNAASYTDCTTYGCFYVQNNTGANKIIWDGGGFIDLNGADVFQNFDFSIWSPTTNYVFINNSTGTVAILSIGGQIAIAGTMYDDQKTYCTPPANSFVMRDSAGNCVGYINNTGDLWLRGRVCYDASSTSP